MMEPRVCILSWMDGILCHLLVRPCHGGSSMKFEFCTWLLAGFYVYLNTFLSVVVFSASKYSFRRILYLLLIWGIPFIGYLLASLIMIHTGQSRMSKKKQYVHLFFLILIVMIFYALFCNTKM